MSEIKNQLESFGSRRAGEDITAGEGTGSFFTFFAPNSKITSRSMFKGQNNSISAAYSSMTFPDVTSAYQFLGFGASYNILFNVAEDKQAATQMLFEQTTQVIVKRNQRDLHKFLLADLLPYTRGLNGTTIACLPRAKRDFHIFEEDFKLGLNQALGIELKIDIDLVSAAVPSSGTDYTPVVPNADLANNAGFWLSLRLPYITYNEVA